MSNRRRDGGGSPPPSRSGGIGSSKLRMDREPVQVRISDPKLMAGKRKEIDNVMKKARASTNDYWDKRLLEAEEKDPNRWRHTGFKKMYIEGDSSSDSDREPNKFRYNNGASGSNRKSRSRSRNRRTPPTSPQRRRSPNVPADVRRPRSPEIRRRSPPDPRRRPRSPMEPPIRRKSPGDLRRGPPPQQPQHSSSIMSRLPPNKRPPPPMVLPRSKRPPSPPPNKSTRCASNSSLSSCSDDSCSVCSPKHRRARSRSRSNSIPRTRPIPRSPPMSSKTSSNHNRVNSHHHPSHGHAKKLSGSSHHLPAPHHHQQHQHPAPHHQQPHSQHPPAGVRSVRPMHPAETVRGGAEDKMRMAGSSRPHREEKHMEKPPHRTSRPIPPPEIIQTEPTSSKHTRLISKNRQMDDPRLKARPPEPPEPAPRVSKRVPKVKSTDKLRAKVKIEGEKRHRRSSSSGSDDSSSSESSIPSFTATTRLTLSERFGKMAQWSLDRSNMENMRITKDSSGGALKVMIEEGTEEQPPRRYNYSPAPVGHFPEELAMTAPSGLMSWDDVRVRYEYYKSRGYLRDLDLEDYIKWEEWWYKYQEWLKQERYYEFWERQHHMNNRRRRKKIPITQRLN